MLIDKSWLNLRKFFALAPSSKKCAKSFPNFFSLGGKDQDSDMKHFLEDGKTFRN